MTLEGKVALITGGGRGIGRAIASALAGAGTDVALLSRTAAQLDETAAIVRAQGRRALSIPADVSDARAVEAAVEQVTEKLGAVTILVNNAGIAPSLKFQETTDEIWHRTMNINAAGAFYCARAVLPAMLDCGWGRIINIASTAGKVGYLYNAAYVASKHAVVGLTRALALEVARKGVTVNAICPGFVDTEIVQHAVDNLVARTGRTEEEALRTFASMSPQGRLMSPEEVAACVLYLASDAARGVNGQTIVIDGGGVQT